jgi:hypothetical protein
MNMASVRRWHSYIGLFIAPSVLFFALTGAVQLFSLHEAHGKYQPPALVEKLSSVHKDQVFSLGDHHAQADSELSAGKPAADAGTRPGNEDDEPAIPTYLLKGFFLLVALSLAVSTALGLWMGLTQTLRRRTHWALVIAGLLIPISLLLV